MMDCRVCSASFTNHLHVVGCTSHHQSSGGRPSGILISWKLLFICQSLYPAEKPKYSLALFTGASSICPRPVASSMRLGCVCTLILTMRRQIFAHGGDPCCRMVHFSRRTRNMLHRRCMKMALCYILQARWQPQPLPPPDAVP